MFMHVAHSDTSVYVVPVKRMAAEAQRFASVTPLDVLGIDSQTPVWPTQSHLTFIPTPLQEKVSGERTAFPHSGQYFRSFVMLLICTITRSSEFRVLSNSSSSSSSSSLPSSSVVSVQLSLYEGSNSPAVAVEKVESGHKSRFATLE